MSRERVVAGFGRASRMARRCPLAPQHAVTGRADDLPQGRYRECVARLVQVARRCVRGRDRARRREAQTSRARPSLCPPRVRSGSAFRGIEVRGVPELIEGDVTPVREGIAGRYLGANDGRRFAAERTSKPGVLLRLSPDEPTSVGSPRDAGDVVVVGVADVSQRSGMTPEPWSSGMPSKPAATDELSVVCQSLRRTDP